MMLRQVKSNHINNLSSQVPNTQTQRRIPLHMPAVLASCALHDRYAELSSLESHVKESI